VERLGGENQDKIERLLTIASAPNAPVTARM
ncbi:MAG: hypothetical protein ACI8Z1_002991, partial [Candidatus Azotimanducaceae bacterium]